jgi:hypothetical protein
MFLDSPSVELAFAEHVKWDVGSFAETCAKWISNPDMTGISQVGAMSSPQFQNLITPLVGDAISREFRCMVYAMSLAHTQQGATKKQQYTLLELQIMGLTAGEQFLPFLERQLSPQSLANRSRYELQVIFLMIVGTILAIGYARPTVESPPFPSIEVSFVRQYVPV